MTDIFKRGVVTDIRGVWGDPSRDAITMGGPRAGAGRGLATLTMRLCSCRWLHGRHYFQNQLTSLPSGIFDQLTALTEL